MTRRRWIADRWDERSAALTGGQAAHLVRVLRARPGQQFDIVAGDAVRVGVIETLSDEIVEFSLHEELEAADALPLTLAISIVRFEPMDWAIEKLTELGVAEIVPLIAQRSDKHLVQSAGKRVERWRRIAREAAQQSRRSNIPEIRSPVALRDFLEMGSSGLRLLFSEHERIETFWNVFLRDIGEPRRMAGLYAAIGPEGGWTETELSLFAQHGWKPVTLGPRILRAETAAVAVASIVSACGAVD